MPTTEIDKPYISQSQLNSYMGCSAHYLFSYVCGIKMPPRAAMAQGSAIHKGLGDGYQYKIDNGKDPKLNDLLGIFEQDFAERIANEVEKSKKDDPTELLLDQGVELLKKYHAEKMPTITPKASEVGFEVDFKNKNYKLLGFIDLADTDGIIHDHKVSTRAPSENDIKSNQQLSAYSLGYQALFGEREKGVVFDYLLRGKNPKIVTHKSKRTLADHKRFLTNVAYIMQAIESQLFFCFHTPTNSWICSPDWCGYEERGYHKELYKIGVNKFIEKYAGRIT